MPTAINTCLLFEGAHVFNVWITHPKDEMMMMDKQTNSIPVVLINHAQISGFVAARYRQSNARNRAASPAHKAKKIIDPPL